MVAPTFSNFSDAHEAWKFLQDHPIFENEEDSGVFFFEDCLSIEVVKVNPRNKIREEDESKNTEINIWLECGPWIKASEFPEEAREHNLFGISSHDIALDCGSRTFELALCELATLVAKKYGLYGSYKK